MAILQDTSNITVLDNRAKENLIFDFQESRNYLHTLSFGAHGLYAVQLVESPDFYPLRNGVKGNTRIPFYLLTSEQFETVNVSYLNSQAIKEGTGKTSVNPKDKAFTDIYAEFTSMVEYDSDKPDSYIGNWIAVWRMACAIALHFATIKAKPANMPVDKLQFAMKNWQENSPRMLRAMWENEQAAKVEAAKVEAAKVTTQQTSKAAKAAKVVAAEKVAA